VRGLPALAAGERAQARRWDAVVLGGAIPGLVASVVLAMRGARVLVLEEEAAARTFPGRREPFCMPPARSGGVLGGCLGALGIPLIERRRIAAEPVAYQVVLPEARIDWGEPARTIDELVAWTLAKPELASELVRGVARAGEAERESLLAASVVRAGRHRAAPHPAAGGAARPAEVARRLRALPPAWTEAPPRLGAMLAAQVRVLSNLGTASPPPRASLRLLGASLEGGGRLREGDPWLRSLLRQRIRSLQGELRTLCSDGLRLVTVGGQPGVTARDVREVFVGRLLVLNAPRAALASCLDDKQIPAVLRGPEPSHRRLALHFRLPERALPEGMAPRVVRLADPAAPAEGTNVVALGVFRGGDGMADLLAQAVVPAEEFGSAARVAEIEAAVASLMPFAAEELERQPESGARWDRDDGLWDPPRGSAWPADTDVRLSGRPPIYGLDRSGVAALGFEGDLLLGWRAGDAIAADSL